MKDLIADRDALTCMNDQIADRSALTCMNDQIAGPGAPTCKNDQIAGPGCADLNCGAVQSDNGEDILFSGNEYAQEGIERL